VAAVLSAAVLPALPRLLPAAGQGVAYVLRQTTLPSGRDFAAGGYLSYPREWLNVIAESRPLLPDLSVPAFVSATRDLSAGLLLLPVALFLWARSGRHAIRVSGSRPRARLLLVLFGAVTLVMALSQRRNVYYLGIFTALALAEAVGRLTTLFRKASWRAAAVPVGVLLALLLVAVPGLPTLIRLRDYADAPGHDMLDLMARLKALDPPGADPAALPLPAPGAIPGVMAPWSMGHFVTALAERPAAADPFAYGWRRQCRLFTASDDAEAWDILKTARCRYLVTTDLRPVLPFYASAAARPPASVDTMFSVRVHESALEKPLPFLTKVLDSRTAARTPDGRIVPRFRVFRVDGAP
jgi:asparagine N-glycosylation enzyme membrane subunit Stt3